MSESAINIVLNAIDNYSGAITGLNQGLELLGKGFGYVKDAAGFAFDTIGKGIELAKVGGAFQEQRAQFENLAASYKQSGQSIIDTVRETASYTVNEMDSIKVATKAMAAGLQGDNMKVALSYLKKWSEATGESFLSVSERAFTALSSGKTALLNQMGLFIDKSDDLNAIVGKMSDNLKRFGDTGFNAADKFDALTAAQDDFWRKIGQGVNNSEGFQAILTALTDAVVGFVKGFNPAPVTLLFNLITDGAISLAKTFVEAFPAIGKVLETLFTSPAESAKNLSRAGVDAFFSLYKAAAEAVNGVLDTFQSINSNNLLGDLASGVLQFFTFAGSTFVSVVEKSVTFAADLIAKVLSDFGQFLADSPKIAEFLGVDPSAFNFEQSAEDLKQSVRTVTGAFKLGFDDLFVKSGDLFTGLNSNFERLKTDLTGIDSAHKTALTSLKALEESYDTSSIKANKMGDAATALQEKIAKLEAKEADKRAKEEAKEAKEAQKEIEKAQKESDKARKAALKDIESAHNRLDKLNEKNEKSFLTRAEKEAEAAVKAAEKKVAEIEKRLEKSGLSGVVSIDLQLAERELTAAKAKLEKAVTAKVGFEARLEQQTVKSIEDQMNKGVNGLRKPVVDVGLNAEPAIKEAEQAADTIQKKFTNFGVALSPGALAAVARAIDSSKPRMQVELDTKDIDKAIKGKIETDVNLKLDKDNRDDKLPPDSAILQWILQVVKNGLVAGAVGEGLPLAITT